MTMARLVDRRDVFRFGRAVPPFVAVGI